MKVLHVISGLGQGGAEGCLVRLALADQQNTHTVISLLDEGMHGATLRHAGVNVHTLNFERGRLTWRGFCHLLLTIRMVRPDVVQTWMCHADFLGGVTARIAGVKTVVWGIRNTLMDRRKAPFSTIIVVKLCAFLSRLIPTRIASCSQIASLEHIAIGYNSKKMVVIPNGIDMEIFQPQMSDRMRIREEIGIAEEDFLFGMIARYDPQKDHRNLIAALGHLARMNPGKWKCVLVGRDLDSENHELMRDIIHHGMQSRIVLLGARRDMPAIMNALDCHVLSSAYGEGFPNVVAEAMACGVPCVATRVGDAELIIGETGWVVAHQEPEALAKALSKAMEASLSDSWSERKQLASRRIRDNFSLTKMVAAYQSVWKGEGSALAPTTRKHSHS